MYSTDEYVTTLGLWMLEYGKKAGFNMHKLKFEFKKE